MTYYMQHGGNFFVSKEANMPIRNVLPVGTYVVNFDKDRGFFLSAIPSFEVKGRIYGDVVQRTDRIITTFHDRPNSTGVILAGEKGSGKTMLTKLLSLTLAEQDIVTIIVNNNFCGTMFNDFIASIEQPALVIFDEFEKVFCDQPDQEALLTLFDGIFSTKKLFVITSNDKYALTKYIINRPGRFFYAFNYAGLDRAFIEDYARENLKNHAHLEKFVKVVPVAYDPVNFDMLKALIEEMNRYDEDLFEVVKYVNVNETKASFNYEIKEFRVKNTEEKFLRLHPTHGCNSARAFAPFTNGWSLYYIAECDDNDGEGPYENTEQSTFYPRNIVKMVGENLIYENDEFYVELMRKPIEEFSVYDML